LLDREADREAEARRGVAQMGPMVAMEEVAELEQLEEELFLSKQTAYQFLVQ
jgi:hypothetical protein